MTLDALDHAFLERWEALAVPAAGAAPACPQPTAPADGADREPEMEPDRSGLVARLLEAAPAEWNAVAAEIEAARTRGRRAIAITAAERSVGCSTIVSALAHVLRRRGRRVVSCSGADAATDQALGGPAHDSRILLVDAGVWFPSGPIRRQRLIAASIGCDAAILVRHADAPPLPAWTVALEAIGVEPLGEIVSFVTGQPEAAA